MNATTRQITRLALELLADANDGHAGGVITLAQILGEQVTPYWNHCDELVVSKAHCCAAEYAFHVIVSKRMPLAEARTYGVDGGLETHSSHKASGVPFTLGSLGLGFAMAHGLAMGDPTRRVWCILGDGELRSGSCREAGELDRPVNLQVIVDWNDAGACQTFGRGLNALPKNAGLDCSPIEAHYRRITRDEIPAIMARLEAM